MIKLSRFSDICVFIILALNLLHFYDSCNKPKPETPIDRSREIDSLKAEIADMRNIRLNDSLRAKVEVRADTLQKQMKRKEKPTHDSLVMKEWFRWISINKQIDK